MGEAKDGKKRSAIHRARLHDVRAVLKNNVVLLVAISAAAITCFFVPPDAAYADYFDVRTLSCLFCTLAVVSALKNIRFFTFTADRIVRGFKNLRNVVLALVFVTYFGSMVMANDMALITFLPLGYFALNECGQKKVMAFTFVMQNIAANLGGMLTPFGNPQNLYLYSYYTISAEEFFAIMAPPFAVAFLLIAGVCLFVKKQPVEFRFNDDFTGAMSQYGISQDRRVPTGIKAAIIREKGTNGEREMAYSLYLAGFDVKDVAMTDLISGRETLEDINMIVYCGGFADSDVLGSAKGWAGGILFNSKAKETLDRYYAREDTLSLGVCNGCQLMIELGLITPDHKEKPKMLHNDSHKFESSYLGLTIQTNRSVMFGSLSGNKLGLWVAHGEGKFDLPYSEDEYNIVAKYSYDEYPGNPNGSSYSAAAIASADGRHIAMMPHLERAIFPWQNAYYPADRKGDEVTPWIEAFVNARKWVEAKIKK